MLNVCGPNVNGVKTGIMTRAGCLIISLKIFLKPTLASSVMNDSISCGMNVSKITIPKYSGWNSLAGPAFVDAVEAPLAISPVPTLMKVSQKLR